jgi:hypothetical protein
MFNGLFQQNPPIAEIQTAHFLSGCAIVAEPERTLPFLCGSPQRPAPSFESRP